MTIRTAGAVPCGARPQVGREFAAELAGKVVLETGTAYPNRDGDMAYEVHEKGPDSNDTRARGGTAHTRFMARWTARQ